LAAWSFVVLAALAALLKYLGCGGCALARSIGRTVLRSPLGIIGWTGILVQLIVLVFAPPADSLAAAVGQLGSIRNEQNKKKKKPFPTKTKPPKVVILSSKKKNKEIQEGILLSSSLPEDAWRLVEASLSFAELGILAAVAKSPHWCAVYTRAARWRRLFAARGCDRQPSFFQQQTTQWSEPEPSKWLALWRGIEISLSADPAEIDAFFERRSPNFQGPALRRRVHSALADRSTVACAWKLACILYERGAPLARCALCGQVDIGDDFVTPCAQCHGEIFHRACLENLLPALPRCTSCGDSFRLASRYPRGPIELSRALNFDRARLLGIAGRCAVKWTLTLAIFASIDSQFSFTTESSVHPALAWFLLQQTLMLEVFFSRRLATVVTRLWSTGSRNAIRFYLRLYLYFIIASAGILSSFSNIGRLFYNRRHYASSSLDSSSLTTLSMILRLFAWTNLLLYSLVSSSCLYLFARTSYLFPTIADRHSQQPSIAGRSIIGAAPAPHEH